MSDQQFNHPEERQREAPEAFSTDEKPQNRAWERVSRLVKRLKPGQILTIGFFSVVMLGALLLTREPSLTVTGLELRENACRLARRTAQRSGWQERLLCRQGDLRRREDLPPAGGFDLVVSNPPYFPPKAGRVSPQETRSVARSEVVCTLEDVCRAAGWLLRWGGRFCVVFPTERLAELLEMARRFGLEPKRLRLVQHDAVGAPGLVLLECRRGGKPGLRAEPTLLLYGPDGRETAEHRRAYFREEEQAL